MTAPANQHVVSTSLELVIANNASIYAGASFLCNHDAVYATVQDGEKSTQARDNATCLNPRSTTTSRDKIILFDDTAVNVFHLSAGSGSVVMKKRSFTGDKIT